MSLDGQGPVTMPQGITPAAPAVDTGTTAAAPDASTGQATGKTSPDTGQTATAPATEEPTFFDPSTLSEELKPAYKQMQAAFTKKMQAISGDRQKIDAYDQFMRDPIGQMQQVAAQYGYNLTRKEAVQALQAQQQAAQDWAPQTWEEVMAKAEERAEQRIMQKLQPFLGNVQKVTASNIERQLSEIDPNWRTYEDDMRSNLQAHPTLVSDVAKLYRLSVPEDVLTSRAVQTALNKFQSKAEQVKISGATRTSRSEPALPDITKMKDGEAFNMALDLARKKIATGG